MKRKVSRSGSKAKKNKVAQWVLFGAAGIFATYYVGVGVKHGTRMLLNKFFDVGVVSVDFKHIYAQSVRDELQKNH